MKHTSPTNCEILVVSAMVRTSFFSVLAYAVAAQSPHATVCNGRACRPGEGNPVVTHDVNPWDACNPCPSQAIKGMPHEPDPSSPQYAPLVAAAKTAAQRHLVYLCAADYDYREVVENWHAAARRVGVSNVVLYALDSEMHAHLLTRGLPSINGTSNLLAWKNRTRLQRHIQAAEAERHLAAAAVAASGLDVLLMESTHVMLGDPSNVLHALARAGAVETAVPRGVCTGRSVGFFGCGPWWSLVWLRGAGTEEQRTRAVAFQLRSLEVGFVDFYLRWWNGAHCIFQGFGKNVERCTRELEAGLTAADLVNLTRPATVRLAGGCSTSGGLELGLLPPSFYAQNVLYGPIEPAGANALISRAPKPSQRDRLRLDRYDQQDFEELVASMKANKLWMLPS